MPSRKEIYQSLLKAKGRYDFIYGRVGDGPDIELDEDERFKKLIDGVREGRKVMFLCHFVWAFGNRDSTLSGILPFTGVIDRIVEWDYASEEFVITSQVKRYQNEEFIMVKDKNVQETPNQRRFK